jgi:dihydroxy-acid dehydratase
VTIDVDSRRIDVDLSEQELADRLASYAPPALDRDHLEIAIRKYARLVGSASEGAVAR